MVTRRSCLKKRKKNRANKISWPVPLSGIPTRLLVHKAYGIILITGKRVSVEDLNDALRDETDESEGEGGVLDITYCREWCTWGPAIVVYRPGLSAHVPTSKWSSANYRGGHALIIFCSQSQLWLVGSKEELQLLDSATVLRNIPPLLHIHNRKCNPQYATSDPQLFKKKLLRDCLTFLRNNAL
jgi:hypothetical protein